MKIVKIKFHVVMILIIRKQYNMNSGYEPVDVVFCFLDNINTTKLSFHVVRLAETSFDILKMEIEAADGALVVENPGLA